MTNDERESTRAWVAFAASALRGQIGNRGQIGGIPRDDEQRRELAALVAKMADDMQDEAQKRELFS